MFLFAYFIIKLGFKTKQAKNYFYISILFDKKRAEKLLEKVQKSQFFQDFPDLFFIFPDTSKKASFP